MRRTGRISNVPKSLVVLGLAGIAGATSCLTAPDGRPLGGACVGWRDTQECSSTGPRDPANDQDCSTPIDSTHSGYCDCGGSTIDMNCGHSTFTCAELCAASSGTGGSYGGGGAPSTGGETATGGTYGGGTGGFAGTGGFVTTGGTGGLTTGGTGGFVSTGGTGGTTGGTGGTTGGTGGTLSNPCIYFPYTTGYGYSCGANLSPQADPRRLYLCNGTTTTGSVLCPSGCYAAPAGQADYCYGTSANPCVNSPYNGDACGANLAPYANQSTLYTCSGQQTVGSIVCVYGCHASPPGSADYCN